MARGDEATVRFEDVEAVHDTGQALKCIIDGEEYWIPHSQIHDNSEVFDAEGNSRGKLVITEWLARQKGLI